MRSEELAVEVERICEGCDRAERDRRRKRNLVRSSIWMAIGTVGLVAFAFRIFGR